MNPNDGRLDADAPAAAVMHGVSADWIDTMAEGRTLRGGLRRLSSLTFRVTKTAQAASAVVAIKSPKPPAPRLEVLHR